MDQRSLEFIMRQPAVSDRSVPLTEQSHWVAAGSGLLALVHGLEDVVGRLIRIDRPERAPFPPSAVVDITSRGRRPGSPSLCRRIQPRDRRSPDMTSATEGSDAKVIDVRSLVPVERHKKIFELVEQLVPGASFILVNDHDPKPLYYQIEAEHPKQFSWTYLERGPEAWRVEIGKLAEAA